MQSTTARNGTFFGEDVSSCRLSCALLLEKRHAPGEVLPGHRHERPYLSFVLTGGYRETLKEGATACGPGTLLVHPPGESHEDRFGDRASTLLVIEPSPETLGERAARAFERRSAVSGPSIRRLVSAVRRETRNSDELSDLAIQGVLFEISAEVLRSSREIPAPASRPPSWLREARRIVLDRFRGGIGLSGLAAEVDVHPSHLAREFRRHYDTSVGELVRTSRIEHALERIDSSASLADLAAECGFADQSHFTRCFSRIVGTTPAAYRASSGSKRP